MDTIPHGAQPRLDLLYQISREIAGRLDLAELLARVLQSTVAAAQARAGSLVVVNEQGDVLDSALVWEGAYQPDPEHRLAETLRNGLAGWVLARGQPALVADTRQDPRWGRRPDDAITGAKSAIAVPLLGRARTVGVLTLVRVPADTFAADDLVLLTAIADEAGVAIENAQLYAESERRAEAMRALADTARAIHSSLRLDEVLRQLVRHARSLLRVETAAIALAARLAH